MSFCQLFMVNVLNHLLERAVASVALKFQKCQSTAAVDSLKVCLMHAAL